MPEKSYAQFRAEYEEQHPASVPVMEADMSYFPFWLKYVILLMFISITSILAVHTIPVVYAGIPRDPIISEWMRVIVAYLSPVAIELSLLTTAYLIYRGVVGLSRIMAAVSGILSIIANVTSVYDTQGQTISAGAIAITFGFGIGAPLMAYAAGKLYVHIHAANRSQSKEARDKYRTACVQFDAAVLDAYNNYTSSERLIRQDTRQAGQQTSNAGYGYDRNANATELVMEYLDENPEAYKSLSMSQLADAVTENKGKVSRATAHTARQKWIDDRNPQGYINGAGNDHQEAD